MKYFVSFVSFGEYGKINIGNTSVELSSPVTCYSDIEDMEEIVGKKYGPRIGRPIIINYKPLDRAEVEYVRAGDAESLKASGYNLTLVPNINVTFPAEASGNLSVDDIANHIKKMLIEQMDSQRDRNE